jgi:two-component system alkaline phosphatase synthesis response regulator PhoP
MDRRAARASGRKGQQLRWRDLIVDVDTHRVLAGAREINLRPLELKLLLALFAAGGRLVSRTALLEAVWGPDSSTRPRLVDVHVWRLRARLEDHGDLIATVHGSGYRLAEE